MSIKDSVTALVLLKEVSKPSPHQAPRWPLHYKARFFDLPPDLQEYVIKREDEREKYCARLMSERDKARQELANLARKEAISEKVVRDERETEARTNSTDRTTDGKTDAA